MKRFRHENRENSAGSRALYAKFEMAYTFVDFCAAICFVVGSALFFFESTQTSATWLFLIGSIFFAAKPCLRVIREIKLYRMGDMADLAKRYEN